MNTKALKPFDLEKALSGDPVVFTGASDTTYMPIKGIVYVPLADKYAVVYNDSSASIHNLRHIEEHYRMAPKKVTRWVNLYKDNVSYHYYSKEVAIACACVDALAVAVPVEYEE